jgi:hypothetical protein
MKKLAALFLLLFSVSLFPQTYKYVTAFGGFNNARSFNISAAGFIYITDTGTDAVYKYDTLGNYIKEAGGYGWDNSSFDDPFDVFATPLNIFIADKNNHRIVQYDKDLNYISLLATRESNDNTKTFGYPLSCAASPQGDLYILDSENSRVLKFDLFGNFIQNFGGYDAGSYALNTPKKLAVSPINYIYVLDKDRIVIFDPYGNGAGEIKLNDSFISINIVSSCLTVNSAAEVYKSALNEAEKTLQKLTLSGPAEMPDIQASFIYNNKLYILSQSQVLIYSPEQ